MDKHLYRAGGMGLGSQHIGKDVELGVLREYDRLEKLEGRLIK